MEIIEERLKKFTEDFKIKFIDGQFAAKFCDLMSKEADALVVFHA